MGTFALAVALVHAPVAMASTDRSVARQAWTQSSPVPTFAARGGRLYVAADAQLETARVFITFDLSALRANDVEGPVLVLREAPGESLLADSAVLAVCAMSGSLDGDGQIEQSNAPSEDCSVRVDVRRGEQGDWSVPLASLAPRWDGGEAAGIVLLPAPDAAPGTFRITFDASLTTVDQAGAKESTYVDSSTAGSPHLGEGESSVDLGLSHYDTPLIPSPSLVRPSSEAAGGLARGVAAGTSKWREPFGLPTWPFVLGLLLCAAALLAGPSSIRRRIVLPARIGDRRAQGTVGATLLLALALLPLGGTEVTTFKAGLVLILLVAALGLQILVNWAGQLSLAHAGMVGLPAFTALSLSEISGVSPIYLVPVAVIVGGVVGAVVAVPTLRAQGLQVALVTLAVGVGIDRFFFTKPWLVGGPSGRAAAAPRLGPWNLETSHQLYPVLLVFVALAAAAAWLLMHSKLARAWFWVRSDPTAAAAFGIPVVAHRVLAFAVAGAFAGLAGGLSAMWVGRISAQTFPVGLSFTYILVVVISGPGYIGGVACAAALIEGGRLFSSGAGTLVAYVGPLALIFVITRYTAGINGVGRRLMERARGSGLYKRLVNRSEVEVGPIRLGFIVGSLAIVGGFLSIGLAYYHLGSTNELWLQNQEIVSGGFLGLALVITGGVLLIRDRIRDAQAAVVRHLAALAAARELDSVAVDHRDPGAEAEAFHTTQSETVRAPLSARTRS